MVLEQINDFALVSYLVRYSVRRSSSGKPTINYDIIIPKIFYVWWWDNE